MPTFARLVRAPQDPSAITLHAAGVAIAVRAGFDPALLLLREVVAALIDGAP